MIEPIRDTVAARAGYCCEYCRSQERFATHRFSVEHIIPLSKGGQNHPDNLAYACQGCNNYKYTKTAAPDPLGGESAALFNPRRHRWNEHFSWNEDCTCVIGMTPVGRATVEALQLNRACLINLRRILFAVNKHPPANGADA